MIFKQLCVWCIGLSIQFNGLAYACLSPPAPFWATIFYTIFQKNIWLWGLQLKSFRTKRVGFLLASSAHCVYLDCIDFLLHTSQCQDYFLNKPIYFWPTPCGSFLLFYDSSSNHLTDERSVGASWTSRDCGLRSCSHSMLAWFTAAGEWIHIFR